MRTAVRDGITEMILTPHIFVGRWDNNLTMLRPRFEAVCRLVESKEIPLKLHLGAEVHLQIECIDLIDRAEVPMLGTWDGDRALLLEMHDGRIPPFTLAAVRHLRTLGIQPVIAHPERNRAVMKSPACLQELVQEGCLFQITAGSITGGFGERAAWAAFELLDRGWVQFIATDAHNLRRRPPLMREARDIVAQRYGVALAGQLTHDNPLKLLARSD